MIRCPDCSKENETDARFCAGCVTPLTALPTLETPAPDPEGDVTGGVIPYKNIPALAAYYLGLFSSLPILGILLGLVAVPLGVMGLKKKRAEPHVRGTLHAWVGIGCGSLGILVWGGIIVLVILGN